MKGKMLGRRQDRRLEADIVFGNVKVNGGRVSRQGRGKRFPEKITVNMYFTDARVLVVVVNGVLV
jgi:hypothetical protein